MFFVFLILNLLIEIKFSSFLKNKIRWTIYSIICLSLFIPLYADIATYILDIKGKGYSSLFLFDSFMYVSNLIPATFVFPFIILVVLIFDKKSSSRFLKLNPIFISLLSSLYNLNIVTLLG